MTPDLLIIAFSLMIWGFGESMFFYFLPLSLQMWGATPVLIGAVLGGIGLAAAIAQIPAGYLSDRYGARYLMWTSWIIGMVSTLMMVLAKSMLFFIVGLWFYYFTAFVVAPLNSYIIHVRGKFSVERSLTLVSGMYSAGAIAGPVVGGLIAKTYGLPRIYLAAFFIFTFSTALIFFLKLRKFEKPPAEHKPVHIFRNTRYITLVILAFFSIIILALPQQLTSNYLENQQNLSLVTIGLLGTIGNAGKAFATLVLGGLDNSIGLIIGHLMVAVFSICLYFGKTPWLFGLGYFAFGGYPLSRLMLVAKIRSTVKDHEVGFAFGILETIGGFAVVLTPLLAGWLYSKDPRLVYLISFPLVLLLIAITLIIFRKIRIPKTNNLVEDES